MLIPITDRRHSLHHRHKMEKMPFDANALYELLASQLVWETFQNWLVSHFYLFFLIYHLYLFFLIYHN